MRLLVFTLLAGLAGTTAAVACPAMNMSQGATNLGAGQLASPMNVMLSAGGENRLDQCGLGMLGFGQFRSAPDYSFVVEAGFPQDVVLAVTSDCDAAMLVNTADGQWHFNDDANGNLDPRLTIPAGAALEGQVDVWLGTFAGGDCAASLTLAQADAAPPVSAPSTGPAPGANVATTMPPPLPGTPAPIVPQPQMPQTVQTPQPVPVPVPVPAPAPAPMPVPVAICPNPNMVGPSLTLVGAQLLQPQAYMATVGGPHDLSGCPGIDAWGSATEAPSFTLYLSQMAGFQLTTDIASDCDPTLLMRDAFGQWHFNDDTNGLQPQLVVDGASLNGKVDIWVGGFGSSACQGTITFRTASTMPQGGGMMMGGCPNPSMQGVPVSTTGSALYSPTDYFTTASGSQQLSACGLPVFSTGYFNAQPNFSFFLSGMQEYGRLEIEGEASCDTVLLVRTPDGQWFLDDDSNGNLNPRLDLTNMFMLNGRVDVWVGSYSGTSCPATIELETWHS
ncbi:hypothetical protein [Roseicyclus marinus]|jgi:hypothetical protein|uniref:Uncharacterized protein n=1 Tax=Roseicyclus marinus TaxID=2161673 RepID=A0AA48KMC5_9RHOB|nr:hypothetical protein MACH21_11530 [Roseicyclus marinus]